MDIIKKTEYLKRLLRKFSAADHKIIFECPPDGKVPAEKFDYHIHKCWELKFSFDPPVLCIHAPQTVHCTTMSDIVMAVSHSFIRIFDYLLEFTEEEIHCNLLPELLEMLRKLPEDERTEPLKRHLSAAAINNCMLLLEMFSNNAEQIRNQCSPAEIALDYMENHYFHKDLTVRDIARFAGISQQSLNQTMNRLTGGSIRQNLIRIRLEHAAELLKDSRYRVKDIATMTGWSSPFFFSNCFHKKYGFTPSDFTRDRSREKMDY